MTPRPPRNGQALPGVRELFPDLFHPRPVATPQTLPLSTPHDSQQCTTYDITNLPSVSTPRHSQLTPSDRPTSQDTATGPTDHPYTRARSDHLAPPYFRAQPHVHIPTRWWPDRDVVVSTPPSHMSPRYTSPEVSSPYTQPQQLESGGVGPSTLPDKEQSSSPMTSSPNMDAEFALQSTPFEQNSVETHPGKKRHKCDVCGSYWGRPSSLKIHMVSHTGVKEFVCSICKQDFGVKSNYTRHIRVHHKDSSEGIRTRVVGRRRRGSRRNQDVGPVRFVDEGPKFQGQ